MWSEEGEGGKERKDCVVWSVLTCDVCITCLLEDCLVVV